MKTKKNEEKKFKLEKFEIAKLKNLLLIKGGEVDINATKDLPTFTAAAGQQSGGICIP